jgi:hypothetical protein
MADVAQKKMERKEKEWISWKSKDPPNYAGLS